MSDLDDFPFIPREVTNAITALEQQNLATSISTSRQSWDEELGPRADPSYAGGVEAFESLAHEEIFSKVQALDPGALGAGAAQWAASMAGLTDLFLQHQTSIVGEIANGWRGVAAEAAEQGTSVFANAGGRTTDVMTSVVSRLNQAAAAAEAVKIGVPPPETVNMAAELPLALLVPSRAVDVAAAQRRAEEARQEAIRVMNAVYKGSFTPVGDGVPAFTSPPSIGDGSGTGNGTGSGSGSGSGSGGFGNSSSSANGQGAGDPADTKTAGLDGAGQGAVGQGAGATGTGAGSSSSGSPLTSAASTGSDSYGKTGSNAYGGSSAGAGGSGGLGGGSIGGRRKEDEKRDAMAGGITGMGMGAIGGGMAGAMLAGNDALRSGASVASGAVAAGKGGGMPGGMMPGGRKADGEDEQEHETPTYLINVENGNELIGDIAPAAPPVLGVWDEE